MEVKPGYKLTEVGVIPEDWEVAALGKHASFRTGPFGSALHQSDYVTGGIPIINPMHIIDGNIVYSETMTVTEETAKSLSDFKLKLGDIVIGRRGDMGRCAVVREQEVGWLCGTGSMIIRPSDVDADYLQRVLSSREIITAIENSSVGTTMVNLNQGSLYSLKIQFPPSLEQRAIAQALSDVDALLATLDQAIAKKRDLKQATMQQLLTGKTRLPGFSGEWVGKRLEELCAMKSGEGITAKNIDTYSEYPCYGGNGLRGFTTRFTHDGNYCLIGRVGALCGNLVNVSGKFFASEHAIVVTALDGVDISWLTLALGTLALNRRSESSAQPVLTVSKLRPLELQAPPTKEEQSAIALALAEMDAEISTFEARREKTRNIKQAMMQELLTGKTRLV